MVTDVIVNDWRLPRNLFKKWPIKISSHTSSGEWCFLNMFWCVQSYLLSFGVGTPRDGQWEKPKCPSTLLLMVQKSQTTTWNAKRDIYQPQLVNRPISEPSTVSQKDNRFPWWSSYPTKFRGCVTDGQKPCRRCVTVKDTPPKFKMPKRKKWKMYLLLNMAVFGYFISIFQAMECTRWFKVTCWSLARYYNPEN